MADLFDSIDAKTPSKFKFETLSNLQMHHLLLSMRDPERGLHFCFDDHFLAKYIEWFHSYFIVRFFDVGECLGGWSVREFS